MTTSLKSTAGGGSNSMEVHGAARSAAAVSRVFFFFSSRRRHTRLTCDWSSDVCSSDLPLLIGEHGRQPRRELPHHGQPLEASVMLEQKQGLLHHRVHVDLPFVP